MADYIGLRVARWRTIAGLTQQQLADAVGVSRPYITLIEGGDRPVTRRSLLIDLATALGVSVSQLLDQPAPVRSTDDLVMSRAAAQVRIALDGEGVTTRPDPTRLRERADEVIALRAACDFPALAERLPVVLAEARYLADSSDVDASRIGLDALVRVAVFGCYALKTSGYVDLAVRLAEHAHAAATRLASPVHLGAARMALCQGWMAEGVRTRSLATASAGADALAALVGRDDDATGWYANLRMQAGLCAASLGDHAAAGAHLDDAADAAAAWAGPTAWHRDHLATDVAVWRVTVCLENGDPERAPDLVRRIDRSRLRTPQRLARVYMDHGRGLFARGDRTGAETAFVAALETAPGEVRNRGTVREIVGQMARDAGRTGGSDRLRRLTSALTIDPTPEM